MEHIHGESGEQSAGRGYTHKVKGGEAAAGGPSV